MTTASLLLIMRLIMYSADPAAAGVNSGFQRLDNISMAPYVSDIDGPLPALSQHRAE